MPKSNNEAIKVSEQQTLGWLWRALKLSGRAPRALDELTEAHFLQLDEAYPLPVGWDRVFITCVAFPVCRDIWQDNADSIVHDLLSQARAGVLLVSDSTVVRSAENLHLIYGDTPHVDPLSFDLDTPPQLVHPGWQIACEKLKRHFA